MLFLFCWDCHFCLLGNNWSLDYLHIIGQLHLRTKCINWTWCHGWVPRVLTKIYLTQWRNCDFMFKSHAMYKLCTIVQINIYRCAFQFCFVRNRLMVSESASPVTTYHVSKTTISTDLPLVMLTAVAMTGADLPSLYDQTHGCCLIVVAFV